MTPEQLKASILQYAMEGKLVKQYPTDVPASELLKKIKAEKAKLIKEKKIRRIKLSEITQEEIPFEIPDSWEWTRLDTILDVRDGTHDTPSYVDVGVPLITGKNISNGHLDFDNVQFISEQDAKKINDRSKVNFGDIIFAMIGSIGNPVIVNTKKTFSIKNVALLKNIDASIDMNYVLKYLIFAQKFLLLNASGAVQKFISLKKIRMFLFPLPPLEEQKRIVAKIDQLMPLVDQYALAYNRLKEIDNSFNDKMKQSILQYAMEGKLVTQDPTDELASELLKKIKAEKAQLIKEKKIRRNKKLPEITQEEIPFEIPAGWEWTRLQSATLFGNFESVSGDKIIDGEWVVDMKDVNKNGGGFNNISRKTPHVHFKSNKYKVNKASVLYGKLRPYLKKVEIAPFDGYTSTEIFPIQTLNGLLPTYLRYCLLSPYFVNTINQSMYGIKMPRVGTQFLASQIFPLPPLDEQKRIVAKIDFLFQKL